MLLLIAAVIGTLGGLWHGGALWRFARLRFRWPVLFLIGLLLRGMAFARFVPSNALTIGLYLLALGCLVVGILLNRRIVGIELVLIGLLLNAAVILVNGGTMPVSADALRLVGHYEFALQLRDEGPVGHVQLATSRTQLGSLSDIIPLPPLPGFRIVVSLGDLFIATGILIVFYVGTLRPFSTGGPPERQPEAGVALDEAEASTRAAARPPQQSEVILPVPGTLPGELGAVARHGRAGERRERKP